MDKSVDKSVEKSVEQLIEKSVDKSVEKSVEKSAEKSFITFVPLSHLRLFQEVFSISEIKYRKCLQEYQEFLSKKFLIPAGHSLLLVTWFHFSVHNHWMGITDWQEAQSKDKYYFRY